MQIKSKHTLGGMIFFLAILIGLALALATTWANYEAVNFFYTGANYDSFGGLSCPNLLTLSDTGLVTASFDNPTGEDLEPYYEVGIAGESPRSFRNQLTVPPHQSRSVQWTVDANDLKYGNLIFVKVEILPDAYYSDSQAACGILVLNVPAVSGGQILGLSLSVALLGMVLGLGLWESSSNQSERDHPNQLRARQALGVFASLAMLAGLIGLWAAGTLLCALTILMLIIILPNAFS